MKVSFRKNWEELRAQMGAPFSTWRGAGCGLCLIALIAGIAAVAFPLIVHVAEWVRHLTHH